VCGPLLQEDSNSQLHDWEEFGNFILRFTLHVPCSKQPPRNRTEEEMPIKSPVPCMGTLNNALLCFIQMIF
jgi:hypothetical protein